MIRLTLPLPPTPNVVNGWGRGRQIREKLAYKRQAWVEACRQSPPLFPEDIPKRVRIVATFYTKRKWDADAPAGALKWVLDLLKWKILGPGEWKRGICDERAYIWDDTTDHVELPEPAQEVDRKNPRLELTITPQPGVTRSQNRGTAERK